MGILLVYGNFPKLLELFTLSKKKHVILFLFSFSRWRVEGTTSGQSEVKDGTCNFSKPEKKD